MTHIGIDLHSRTSQICQLGENGEVILNTSVPTTRATFEALFGGRQPCLIALEATGSSPWVEALLSGMGHEVLLLSPVRLKVIATSVKKTDANDAEVLARMLSIDRELLAPVTPRTVDQRALRAELACRSKLVKARTMFINAVRGILRSFGTLVPGRRADTFPERVRELELPEEAREVLPPIIESMLVSITHLTEAITSHDRRLAKRAKEDTLAQLLQQVPGVGPVIALGYMAAVGDPTRFESSRKVPAYLGLVPVTRASADKTWQGRISKRGDSEMRRLLIQGAQVHLIHGKDSALKAWGDQLTKRIGKRKAVVAVARKLAVLLHRMWVTGMCYEPRPGGSSSAPSAQEGAPAEGVTAAA